MISDYLLSPDPTAVLVGLHMIQHVTPEELWEELLLMYDKRKPFVHDVRTRKFSVNPRSFIAISIYKELGLSKIALSYPHDVEVGESICIVLDLDYDIDVFISRCYWNIDGWDARSTTQVIYKKMDEVTDEDKLLIYNKLLEYIHHEDK